MNIEAMLIAFSLTTNTWKYYIRIFMILVQNSSLSLYYDIFYQLKRSYCKHFALKVEFDFASGSPSCMQSSVRLCLLGVYLGFEQTTWQHLRTLKYEYDMTTEIYVTGCSHTETQQQFRIVSLFLIETV